MFVGTDKGFKEKSEMLEQFVRSGKYKTLSDIRKAYRKKYPKDFTTVGVKTENAPKKPWIFRGNYNDQLASYDDRVARPRKFLRVGRIAGPEQSAFITEIARGLLDNELDKPWVSKKDKVVYS